MKVEIKIIKLFEKLDVVKGKLDNVTKIQTELKNEQIDIESEILKLIQDNNLPLPYTLENKSEKLKVKIKSDTYTISSKDIPLIRKLFTKDQQDKYFNWSTSCSVGKTALDDIIKNGAKRKDERTLIQFVNDKAKHTTKYSFEKELNKGVM